MFPFEILQTSAKICNPLFPWERLEDVFHFVSSESDLNHFFFYNIFITDGAVKWG